MSTFLWILFVVIYIAALVVLGATTFRKGHYILFVLGIFFPLLWLVGALIAPTDKAVAKGAR